MALSLHHNPNPLSLFKTPKKPNPNPNPNNLVLCGPRDNRGPLVKGRILSVEAIQAVQALKRAHRSDPETAPTVATKTLSRLIKSDLLATLRELLRQDQCAIALHALSAVRSEYRTPDLALYADVVKSLARSGLADDIDRLIGELETEGGLRWDDKGLITLVRAVLAADRRDSAVRIYGMLKRSVEGRSGFKGDDFMVGALSRGLKRLGEHRLGNEVVSLFGKTYD